MSQFYGSFRICFARSSGVVCETKFFARYSTQFKDFIAIFYITCFFNNLNAVRLTWVNLGCLSYYQKNWQLTISVQLFLCHRMEVALL